MKSKVFYYIKYVFFVILWLFVCYYSGVYLFAGFDLFFFECTNNLVFLDVNILSSLPASSAFCGVFSFLFGYFLTNFALYLYSYHVYLGKNNWYKWFREREKEQRKQNNIDYKNYLKDLKNKKKED